MRVKRLDHLVLTVKNIGVSCEFYRLVLGMEAITFNKNRKALRFGDQKINLHQLKEEIRPCADQPVSGSADLCFICDRPVAEIVSHLDGLGVEIELGPVPRTGAVGTLNSVYIRDPDKNLLELSSYR